MSTVHNPSHLETQNAIAMGKARAKLDDGQSALSIQVHGDAAFSGQGCVYEALSLQKLPKFSCGGSIHIITNNQLGFTTSGSDSRSTEHSSDVVKAFGVPVIRINCNNAESPENLIRVCQLATEYRKTFKKDIMLDMIGFRKHGHNEVDEPSFTQPLMYRRIRDDFDQLNLPTVYARALVDSGILTHEDIKSL